MYSLLKTLRLFSERINLGISEPFLCIKFYGIDGDDRWFILDRQPENPRPLISLPSPPIITDGSSASLGSTVFFIGGTTERAYPSSVFQKFDARLYRWSDPDARLKQWSECPPMSVTRKRAVVAGIGNKVYVLDGDSKDIQANCWAETYDTNENEWMLLSVPAHVSETMYVFGSALIRSKIYLMCIGGGLIFDPKADPEWSEFSEVLFNGWASNRAVVDDILYCLDFITLNIKGYDPIADEWKLLEGLQ